jgi:hypothetical protein
VRIFTSRVAGAACVMAGIGAAACGVAATPAFAATAGNPFAKLSAVQIAHTAIADLRSVHSFHVAGSASESGNMETFSLSLSQKACSGTVAMGKEGSFAIVEIGHTVWIQPDNTFWEHAGVPAARVSAVHGKWIKSSSTSSNKSLYQGASPLCSPGKFTAGPAESAAGWTKGKTTTIAGTRVLELIGKSGAGVVYVSVSAKPEVLRVTRGSAGSFTFSAFGVPVKAVVPPASQVIS